MTNPSDPIYTYPSPDAREVWVPCSKDDPKREEYQCDRDTSWYPLSSFIESSHKVCITEWRKRVPVPDGWVIVPEDYLWDGTSEMRWLSNHAWLSTTWWKEVKIGDLMAVIARNKAPVFALIQPAYKLIESKQPPTKSESDKVIEMLVAAGFVSQQKVDEARAFLRKL